MPKIIATAEAENSGAHYSTDIKVHQHMLLADELPDIGGEDTGPAPSDYLCTALATCKVITVRMYAARKKWKVDLIRVKVDLVKGEEMPSGHNTFLCELAVTGELDEAQQARLLEIAKACPVHRLLSKPSDIVTILQTS
ncbi:OsmC family protein [Chitinophaga agrisoli]|uniref:OsmC family protein n=1 Tax=Chitinophaga agrisoli TaxID=2607653 RepID=A0A5B2VWE9_9BACT|nr:OsmC family protein [Chitinophaga agrisoli]KAA2243641.1 OsmC family protein [Chitinophaga agrisoli]